MPARPTCPYCGATLSAGARYCDRCGTPLGQGAAALPPLRRRSKQERRVAVWVMLVVLMLLFSAGTLGGYRFRSGRWPVALPIALSTGPLQGKTPPTLAQESPQATAGYLRSVVAISAKDQVGSGFIIDDKGHVVTAQHVVDGAGCVSVTDDDGHQHQGTVLNYDKALDIALLHVEKLENWPNRLVMATSSTAVKAGDSTYVLGHPRGVGSNIPASAQVTRLGAAKDAEGRYYNNLIEVGDVMVYQGASGGPLVAKASGQVVGVMVLSSNVPVAWARPTSEIAAKVQEWAKITPSLACQSAPSTRTIPLSLVTVTPLTGAYGLEGKDLAAGAELALRDMQKDLMRVGYEVTIKREDDGGFPAQAREKAELAIRDPKVIGLVGSLESQTTRAIAEALRPYGAPVVSPTAGADDLTAQGWPHFNRVVANNNRLDPMLANFAQAKLKVGNVFVLEDGSVDAAAQVKAFTDGAAVIGLPVSGRFQISAATDAADVKRRLSEARAEAVYYAGSSDLAIRTVRSLRSADVKLPILGNQNAFAPTQFQPFVGTGAEGVYFTRLTAEPVDQFRRRFEEVFGQPTRGYAAYGYDAAKVILAALVRYGETHPAQAPSRAELANLVRQTRGHLGWSSQITFEQTGENQTPWIHVYEWKQGVPVHKGNLL